MESVYHVSSSNTRAPFPPGVSRIPPLPPEVPRETARFSAPAPNLKNRLVPCGHKCSQPSPEKRRHTSQQRSCRLCPGRRPPSRHTGRAPVSPPAPRSFIPPACRQGRSAPAGAARDIPAGSPLRGWKRRPSPHSPRRRAGYRRHVPPRYPPEGPQPPPAGQPEARRVSSRPTRARTCAPSAKSASQSPENAARSPCRRCSSIRWAPSAYAPRPAPLPQTAAAQRDSPRPPASPACRSTPEPRPGGTPAG